MSNKTSPSKKLEDNPMWKEACDLAEYVYGKLHELPEEEKWHTTSKLRSSANELMFYCSQALSNANPAGLEYDWGNTKRSAGSLKTMYRFAGRQGFIELEPEIMVRLNKLIELIDVEIEKSYKTTKEYNDKDLERWREKYKLWKATEL